VVEGPIELGFHEWDIDRFGNREHIPYHVKLSLEGIPQHAWFREVADQVLCDEAIVHHVLEDTLRRTDQRAFECWAYCKDPSRIPQVVYLSLAQFDPDSARGVQVHFVRPRNVQWSHVFRVLIHIDAVEDLLFYHYPREELIADGKVPWRDFSWQYGRADGELQEEELHPPTRYCGQDWRRPRGPPPNDDDADRNHKRSRGRSFMDRMSRCMDDRGSRERQRARTNASGWFGGESSHGRTRKLKEQTPPKEGEDIQLLEQLKRDEPQSKQLGMEARMDEAKFTQGTDAITIIPHEKWDNATWMSEQARRDELQNKQNEVEGRSVDSTFIQTSDAIIIIPQMRIDDSDKILDFNGTTPQPDTCNVFEEQLLSQTGGSESTQKNAHLIMELEERGNINIIKKASIWPEQNLERGQMTSQIQEMDKRHDNLMVEQAAHTPQVLEQINASPTRIVQTIQAQGQELQEVLRLFK
jgi:hypothetical protein